VLGNGHLSADADNICTVLSYIPQSLHFFFPVLEFELGGRELARQMFCGLNHASSPSPSGYFGDSVLFLAQVGFDCEPLTLRFW
jgi:hypothetical protein